LTGLLFHRSQSKAARTSALGIGQMPIGTRAQNVMHQCQFFTDGQIF
jgi:hypothetical protein